MLKVFTETGRLIMITPILCKRIWNYIDELIENCQMISLETDNDAITLTILSEVEGR